MNSLIWIIGVIAAVWVIVEVWTKLKASTTEKLLWTIAALLFSIITAIVYFFVKKRNV
jgi:hypothetical protein